MALTTSDKKKLTFLLTQQSVACDSPFKIAQWTTQIMQKRAVVISYTFYFMRSTFKCYTISSNQTFKSYTISISYQFNFQMLYIHTDVIPFLLLNLHKLYLNMKSSFKSPKLEKRLIGFHYKNLLQLT